MALQESGVQLVAKDQAAFLAALAAANGAVEALGVGSAGAAQQIDKLTGRIEFQQRSLGILAQELDATKAKYGEGSVQAQRKQLAVDKLTASIAKDEAALARLAAEEGQAAQSSGKLEQGLDKAGKAGEVMTGAMRRVGEFAVNALVNAARAVGAFIASSISDVGDYEQSMNLFRATTGASADEMRRAGALAKALGADLTLPATSAAQAGQAMTELAKAGLSVEQAMGAAKGTLQLAAAGGLEEAKAAEIAANALNTFGLAGSQATMVADLLAASANASSIEVTDAADSFKMAGAVWASLQGDAVGAKNSLVDMTTAVGLLGNAGIKGSDAGTSLKQSLLQLAAPSDKAKGLMQELAGRVGITGDLAYDSTGKMRPFKEIIGLVGKSTEGMTQAQRDYTIATIFGADATRSILSLVRAGPDAWDKMHTAVTEQGAAAKLAGARMDGLKGAAAGLQSQIETLVLEGVEPLLPLMTDLLKQAAAFAGSLSGQVGPAVTTFASALGEAVAIVRDLAIPVLAGLSAAGMAWAVTTVPAMIAANGALIVSTALVALPFVAIGAAVTVATLAFQKYNQQIANATAEVLGQKQFWTDAGTAITAYGNATTETQAKTKPLADNLSYMKGLVEEETKTLFAHSAAYEALGVASGYTRESLDKELALINQHATGVTAATAALNNQVSTYEHLHDTDALEDLRLLRGAQDELTQGVHLSAEEMDKWQKQVDKAYAAGAKAVETYVDLAIKFHADLTKAIASGNEQQVKDTALAYAQQAAAARASLGQQLSDWTIAYARMNGVSDEVLTATLKQIEKTFGIASSLGASTMVELQGDIKRAMENGGTSVAGLGKSLGLSTDKAIEMKAKMDALAKKYTAELVDNFDAKKITADELRHKLEEIPARVYSEVVIHTTYTSSGSNRPDSGTSGLAAGGPIGAGDTHLVGERGPELFTPSHDGYIVPNHRISPPASAGQIMNSSQQTTQYNGQVGNTYNYAPTYSQAPKAPVMDFALMKALAL